MDSTSTDTTRLGAVGTSIAAVGIAAYMYFWSRRDRKDCTKLHVEYDHPTMPAIVKILGALPEFIRRPLSIKNATPKPPTDGVDVRGEGCYDPYEKAELEPGRLWRVRYRFIPDPKMARAMKDLFGCDFLDPANAERAPPHMRDRVKKDIDIVEKNNRLGERKDANEALLDAGAEASQDMLIARVDGTEELLLYNPCRMHRSIVEWLNGLGTVAWIVSGSSSHTNQLPQAAEAFPSAKIVCAAAADEKCSSVGMRRADCIYTDQAALAKANETLKNSGIELYHVQGDSSAHALCVVAHGHIFECDLLYGHADGDHFAHEEKEEFETSSSPNACVNRLFFYGLIYRDASPNGFLPGYRFMAMDPTSPFGKLMLDQPKADGSSCSEMAKSLRAMLKLDFVVADSAHSVRAKSMPADEFRRSMDANWNWLDGKSLL